MRTRRRLLKLYMIGGALGIVTVLVLTNPALPDYQAEVLVPVAQESASASDAMLASILSSLPAGTFSPADATASSEVVKLLVARTVRHDYGVLSTYETALDYCPGSSERAIRRTVGIAKRFYIWSKAACAAGEVHAS
jgi:hypothetical protein